jgi:type I restriction enzyme R subunit
VGEQWEDDNEAFSRVKIDVQLGDDGWEIENPNAMRFEYMLDAVDRSIGAEARAYRARRPMSMLSTYRRHISPRRVP